MSGLGTDIIEVARIRRAYKRFGSKFLDKVFTPLEQKYCLAFNNPEERLAGRFAAKEAITKAIGFKVQSRISFLDVEILNNISGRPYVNLSVVIEKALGNFHLLISISHCKEYATATALLT